MTKTNAVSDPVKSTPTTMNPLALGLLCAGLAGSLLALAPCPEVETFATGLIAPSKIIQTPHGNFLVAEGGPEVPNHGRISIVDQQGQRRTLLDGCRPDRAGGLPNHPDQHGV